MVCILRKCLSAANIEWLVRRTSVAEATFVIRAFNIINGTGQDSIDLKNIGTGIRHKKPRPAPFNGTG